MLKPHFYIFLVILAKKLLDIMYLNKFFDFLFNRVSVILWQLILIAGANVDNSEKPIITANDFITSKRCISAKTYSPPSV